jgi:hypothetical protein
MHALNVHFTLYVLACIKVVNLLCKPHFELTLYTMTYIVTTYIHAPVH